MVTTVLNLLYGLKVFDVVFVLTNGGPGRATDTVYTAVFDDFSKGRYGIATALSTLLFLVMIVLGYLTIRVMRRDEAELTMVGAGRLPGCGQQPLGERQRGSSSLRPSTSCSSTRSRRASRRARWASTSPRTRSGATSRPSSSRASLRGALFNSVLYSVRGHGAVRDAVRARGLGAGPDIGRADTGSSTCS